MSQFPPFQTTAEAEDNKQSFLFSTNVLSQKRMDSERHKQKAMEEAQRYEQAIPPSAPFGGVSHPDSPDKVSYLEKVECAFLLRSFGTKKKSQKITKNGKNDER